MRISKFDLCLVWLACSLLVIAVNWHFVSDNPIPLAGLEKFSELKYGVYLAFSSVLPAIWLSMPSLHTTRSLKIFRWLLIVIGFSSMIFLSLPYGFVLLAMSTAARDANAKHKQKYEIDIRKQ
jgi:hypothetical protein